MGVRIAVGHHAGWKHLLPDFGLVVMEKPYYKWHSHQPPAPIPETKKPERPTGPLYRIRFKTFEHKNGIGTFVEHSVVGTNISILPCDARKQHIYYTSKYGYPTKIGRCMFVSIGVEIPKTTPGWLFLRELCSGGGQRLKWVDDGADIRATDAEMWDLGIRNKRAREIVGISVVEQMEKQVKITKYGSE